MAGGVGAVSLMFDFGQSPAAATTSRPARPALRLAAPAGGAGGPGGPGKYEVLAHRRRQAQIRARHLLDEWDGRPDGCEPGAVCEPPLSERCHPIAASAS